MSYKVYRICAYVGSISLAAAATIDIIMGVQDKFTIMYACVSVLFAVNILLEDVERGQDEL
jgi:hypothetical protein